MRVTGNYLLFVRDRETYEHVKPSALSFCKHTNKGIDLIVWDNDSEPQYRAYLRTIFESFEWRSFQWRVVPKTEGGPGVGSLNQRVQREILRHAYEHRAEIDLYFTQEDDYWYAPQWVEKAVAVFDQHPDVGVVNPIDGPFLYANSTRCGWVGPVINPVVDGVVQPTLHNGRPLYLLDESQPPRRVDFAEDGFEIVFSRHIDGSNWYRSSLLDTHGEGMLHVVDHSYNGWPHFYDWCWPDFAMAEWLTDNGVRIACPRPSLHQHRTRPGKGEYASPTFPPSYECV